MIERFGVEAIMGRAYLGINEVNRIIKSERIIRLAGELEAYRDKDGMINWAAWAQESPKDAAEMTKAMMAAQEEGLLN